MLSGRSGDLLVAAIGANTGSQPTFATGWTSLPVLRLSPYRLTTAYQVADADTPCATAGTTTSEWGAALVTFR